MKLQSDRYFCEMSTPVPTDKRGGSAVSPTGGATDTKQGSGEVLNALSGAVGGIQGAFVKAYSQMVSVTRERS